MESRTVALIALYVFVGFVVYVLVAIPPGTGWDGHVSWGDVGTWVSATASFMAVAAALWISGDANRKAAQRDRDMATIIATALCNELRGNRAQLDHTLIWRHDSTKGVVERAKGMKNSLRSIHITAFRLFKNDVRALGTDTAHAVVTAYASLARCNDVEKSADFPAVRISVLPWVTGYVRSRGDVCDEMLHEVKKAIVLLWPLTRDNMGLAAPLTDADEVAFTKAMQDARAIRGKRP